jgi:hypothetical protein
MHFLISQDKLNEGELKIINHCKKKKTVHKMMLDYIKSINNNVVHITEFSEVVKSGFYWIQTAKNEYEIYECTNHGYVFDSFVFEKLSKFRVQSYLIYAK